MTDTAAAPVHGKLRKVATFLMWLSLAVAVISYPGALLLDSLAGRDVILLQSEADDFTVKNQRQQFDDTIKDPAERRTAIVEIYGSVPAATTERVLFVKPEEVIVPQEDTSMSLLRPAKADSYHYQSKSLLYLTKTASMVAGAAFVLLLVIRRFLK